MGPKKAEEVFKSHRAGSQYGRATTVLGLYLEQKKYELAKVHADKRRIWCSVQNAQRKTRENRALGSVNDL